MTRRIDWRWAGTLAGIGLVATFYVVALVAATWVICEAAVRLLTIGVP